MCTSIGWRCSWQRDCDVQVDDRSRWKVFLSSSSRKVCQRCTPSCPLTTSRVDSSYIILAVHSSLLHWTMTGFAIIRIVYVNHTFYFKENFISTLLNPHLSPPRWPWRFTTFHTGRWLIYFKITLGRYVIKIILPRSSFESNLRRKIVSN